MRRTIGPLVALAAVAALTTLPAGAFADVDESDYYAPAVQWLHEEGITGGTSPGCFSPVLR